MIVVLEKELFCGPKTKRSSSRTAKKILVIIPARMDSERLPGKPLLMAGGKALVHWTYERARRTKADYVLVASPDREICRYCSEHGIPWRPTREDHPTGTHRCAEVLEQMDPDKRAAIGMVINWQCDEPSVPITAVDDLMDEGWANYEEEFEIFTLVAPSLPSGMKDPDIAKVAVSLYPVNRCFWFSRAPMRGALGHCGIYCYDTDSLRKLGRLEPTELSCIERLEQLAWIENGYWIKAVVMDELPMSINTKQNFQRFQVLKESPDAD